jgi:hypothetical protein
VAGRADTLAAHVSRQSEARGCRPCCLHLRSTGPPMLPLLMTGLFRRAKPPPLLSSFPDCAAGRVAIAIIHAPCLLLCHLGALGTRDTWSSYAVLVIQVISPLPGWIVWGFRLCQHACTCKCCGSCLSRHSLIDVSLLASILVVVSFLCRRSGSRCHHPHLLGQSACS